jgi:hypothetical protein
MDWNDLISAAIGAIVAMLSVMAKNRLLTSQSKKTNIEAELAITESWKDFAENQQASVAKLEGRIEEIEKSATYWREKHLTTLTNYEELKVKHSTLVGRVAHLEEENAQLVYLLNDIEDYRAEDVGESETKPARRRKSAKRGKK